MNDSRLCTSSKAFHKSMDDLGYRAKYDEYPSFDDQDSHLSRNPTASSSIQNKNLIGMNTNNNNNYDTYKRIKNNSNSNSNSNNSQLISNNKTSSTTNNNTNINNKNNSTNPASSNFINISKNKINNDDYDEDDLNPINKTSNLLVANNSINDQQYFQQYKQQQLLNDNLLNANSTNSNQSQPYFWDQKLQTSNLNINNSKSKGINLIGDETNMSGINLDNYQANIKNYNLQQLQQLQQQQQQEMPFRKTSSGSMKSDSSNLSNTNRMSLFNAATKNNLPVATMPSISRSSTQNLKPLPTYSQLSIPNSLFFNQYQDQFNRNPTPQNNLNILNPGFKAPAYQQFAKSSNQINKSFDSAALLQNSNLMYQAKPQQQNIQQGSSINDPNARKSSDHSYLKYDNNWIMGSQAEKTRQASISPPTTAFRRSPLDSVHIPIINQQNMPAANNYSNQMNMANDQLNLNTTSFFPASNPQPKNNFNLYSLIDPTHHRITQPYQQQLLNHVTSQNQIQANQPIPRNNNNGNYQQLNHQRHNQNYHQMRSKSLDAETFLNNHSENGKYLFLNLIKLENKFVFLPYMVIYN